MKDKLEFLKRPETLKHYNILIWNSLTLKWTAMKACQTIGWVHILKRIKDYVSDISHWLIFFINKNAQVNPGAKLVGGSGDLPCPLLKIKIKFPDLGGKLLCVHQWVTFLILKSYFKCIWEKNAEIFSCGAFFHVVGEMFIEVPLFRETSSVLKNSWLHYWNWNNWDKK